MPVINCAEGSLAAYVPSSNKPWNEQRALHLYRRIMFSASPQIIKFALTKTPEDLVDQLIETADNLLLTPEPEWAYWTLAEYDPDPAIRNAQVADQVLGWARQWGLDMKKNGLRDRMSFFWHNHFVTRADDYGCPSWLYQYTKVLQKHALGNFKEFVREIGITPAMLIFLNNIQNTRFEINENYARELYELFTLGVDNGYTQEDIVQTARAISGWNGIDLVNLCGEVTFIPAQWDSGTKTIFGQTGEWGYDDVIDILFEQRGKEISEHICGKLYKHFVNPKVDEFMVEELASTFRNNNFEIKPVLKQMFSSDHFFEEANIGTVIPGHIEYFMMFEAELGQAVNEELIFNLVYSPSQFDQRIFNPPTVEGWGGNREWINSSSLPYRSGSMINIIGYYYQEYGESVEFLRDFIKEIVDPTETDPGVISRKLIDYWLPKGLQHQEEYDEARVVFIGDVPTNYFDLGIWNLDYEFVPFQVYLLMQFIFELPEYQLK